MQAPRTNIGAIARAGRAAGRSVTDNFEVARAYSPDYTGLAIEGMKARSAEKRVAMEADAKVADAKMQAKGLIKKTELDIEAFDAKNKARSQVRKGQAIQKAGGLIGAAFMDDGPEKPTDYSMLRDLYDKRGKELEADEAAFKPFERTIDPDTKEPIERVTTPRTGTPIAGAVSAAGNVQPMASQQTAGNVKPVAAAAGATLSKTPRGRSAAKRATQKGTGVIGSMGFSDSDFNVFKKAVSQIESGGKYDIAGGSGGHYDGKYQMGAAAKTDAARILGIQDPGHSTGARASFRGNPQQQEQMFEAYTKANHNFLMRNPDYANANSRRKLEILGYAHNQGMGAANEWLKTGKVGRDGFGTAGTAYPTAIRSAFQGI